MIKICGIRRKEDIDYINEFPPDHMGMILSSGFKRTLEEGTAREILKGLDPKIKRTGVFVNEPAERVSRLAGELSLDAVQLHGSEDGEYISVLRKILPPRVMIWKAVRVSSADDIKTAEGMGADLLLLDSFVKGKAGGTGVKADWRLIRETEIHTPFFLAGGINAENIPEALDITPNIDLSGSVETEGVKDREKIREVIEIYNNTICK